MESSGHQLSCAASFQMIYLSTAHLKADDTYIQLKKDLEYLDLKVGPNKVNATLSFSSSSPSSSSLWISLSCCCLQHLPRCSPFLLSPLFCTVLLYFLCVMKLYVFDLFLY